MPYLSTKVVASDFDDLALDKAAWMLVEIEYVV